MQKRHATYFTDRPSDIETITYDLDSRRASEFSLQSEITDSSELQSKCNTLPVQTTQPAVKLQPQSYTLHNRRLSAKPPIAQGGAIFINRSRRKQKSFDISMLAANSDEMSYLKSRARSPSPSPYYEHSREYSESIDYSEYVVEEILITERQYLQDLHDIVTGYISCTSKFQHVQEETIKIIYGNIPQIYTFHKKFLEELEGCDENPVSIAQLFVKHSHEFSIYADYCTNYPNSFAALTELLKDEQVSDAYRKQQLILGHGLTIGSYLHKPVQRVLKYHLLLQSLLRHYNLKLAVETNGTNGTADQSSNDAQHTPNLLDQSDHTNNINSSTIEKCNQSEDSLIISSALQCMTDCAHHINEMKRLHEQTMRVQELQANLYNLDRNLNLLELGAIVHEGPLRMYGARSYRHVYLFEKAVLICKIREDGAMNCKSCIMCHNLMLIEQIKQEPRSFHLVPYDNPKLQHTFQAKSIESKIQWCSLVKRYILDSYKVPIPDKTKQLLLSLTGKSEKVDKVFMKFKSHALKTHQTPDYIEKKRRKSQPNSTGGGETLPRTKKRVRKISADARMIPLIFLTPPKSADTKQSESTSKLQPSRPTSCPPIATPPPRPVSCPPMETYSSSNSSLCRHNSIAEEPAVIEETPVIQADSSHKNTNEPEKSGLWMRDLNQNEPNQSDQMETSEFQANLSYNNANEPQISDVSVVSYVHDSIAEESIFFEKPSDPQLISTNDNAQHEISAASPCLMSGKLGAKAKSHVPPESLAIHDRFLSLPHHTTVHRRHSYVTYATTHDLTSVCDTSHDELSIRANQLRELMKSNTGLDDPTWNNELVNKLKAVRSASNNTESSQDDHADHTDNEPPVVQISKQMPTYTSLNPQMSRKTQLDAYEPRRGRSMEDLIGQRLSMAARDSESDESEFSPSYSGENSLKKVSDSKTETSAIRNTLNQLSQRISLVKLRLFKDSSPHHNSEINLSHTNTHQPIRSAKSTTLTLDEPRRSSLTPDVKSSFDNASDLLHDVGINERLKSLKLDSGAEPLHDNNANCNNNSPDDLWVKKEDTTEINYNVPSEETPQGKAARLSPLHGEIPSNSELRDSQSKIVNGYDDAEVSYSDKTGHVENSEIVSENCHSSLQPFNDSRFQETAVDESTHCGSPAESLKEGDSFTNPQPSIVGTDPTTSTSIDSKQPCLRERLMQTMAGLDVVLNGLEKYNHEQDVADDNNNEKLSRKPSLDFWIALEKYVKYGSVETKKNGFTTRDQTERKPLKEEKRQRRSLPSYLERNNAVDGRTGKSSDSVSQLSSGNSVTNTRYGRVYKMARKYSTRIKSRSQERRLRNQLAEENSTSVEDRSTTVTTRPNRLVRLRRTPSERIRKFTVVLDSDDEGQEKVLKLIDMILGEEIVCGSPSPTEREFSPFNFIRNSADSGTDCINQLQNDDVYERETMEALESFVTTSSENLNNDVMDETTPQHPDYILPQHKNSGTEDKRRARVRRCSSLPVTRYGQRADNSKCDFYISNATSISDRLHSLKHKITSLTSSFRQDISSRSSLQRKNSGLVNEMRIQLSSQDKSNLSVSQDRVIIGEGLVKQAKEKLHVV